MRKQGVKGFLLLVGLMLLSVSLFACSCASPPVPPVTPVPAALPAPETTTLPVPLPTPPPPPPNRGKLILAGEAPWTLDPAQSSEVISFQYILQIFSGLVRLDDDLNVLPDIAARWDLSDDGRTYTFYLRDDVTFHDGKKVGAAQVKQSWERASLPQTQSQTAASYLGDIVGVADVISGASREISGVRVIDALTLEVTIDTPKSYFISKLTYPAAFVVDIDDVSRGSDWWHRPNGTGPFSLSKLDLGTELVLTRHPEYHGERARLDRVIYRFLTASSIQLYETDQVDVAGVSVAYFDRVSDPAGPFASQLHVSPEISYYYVGFNMAASPFDDPLVRRAFARALDKERLVSLIYRDMLVRADGVLPPGLPGHDPDLKGPTYYPKAALALLEQSSYGGVENLPPITLTDSGYGGVVSSQVQALVTLWRETLGVEVRVRQIEPLLFFYGLDEELDQLYSLGWVADYPHPQNFLDLLFRTDAANNQGGYHNPDFDALLDQANAEPDWELARELYREAERILVADAAVIPLTFGQNFYLVKPYVTGYRVNAMGMVTLNRVSVTR